MRALQLDFLNPAGPRSRVGLWILLVGIVAGALAYWHYQSLIAAKAGVESRLADARQVATQAASVAREQRIDPKQAAQELAQANAIVEALNVPWDLLFRELESAANESVALLAIQPESAGRRVRIAGEARRLEDALGYVARLEATPGFTNVFLSGHETKLVTAARTVFFTATADWVVRP